MECCLMFRLQINLPHRFKRALHFKVDVFAKELIKYRNENIHNRNFIKGTRVESLIYKWIIAFDVNAFDWQPRILKFTNYVKFYERGEFAWLLFRIHLTFLLQFWFIDVLVVGVELVVAYVKFTVLWNFIFHCGCKIFY